MSLSKLYSKVAAARALGGAGQPPKPPAPPAPPAGGVPADGGANSTTMAIAAGLEAAERAESARRELNLERARVAAETKRRTDLEAQLAAAKADAERKAIESEIVAAVSAPGRRALSPAHVVALRASRYALVNGQVVLKADPTKALGADLDEFFAGEGKYLLAPTVPGGGAGAPGTATGVQAAPRDLTTPAGLTAFARERIGVLLGVQPSTQVVPTAPAPATSGAGAGGVPGPTSTPAR